MRLGRAGILAMLALCLTGRQGIAQSDPPVLVIGPSLPEIFAPLADRVALVPADRAAEQIGAGHPEMIYVGSPIAEGADGRSALATLLTDLPADRAMIVAINSCGWDGQSPDPDDLTSLLDEVSGVALAVPLDPQGCDAGKLAGVFATAAGQEGAAQRATLRDGGYRLSKTRPETPSPMGGLVISALPSEAMATGTAPPVILASSDPTVSTAPAAETVTANIPFTAERTATRQPGGPEPSIIVGDLAVLVAADARGPMGLPYQAREAIRQRDPAMFDRLLSRGAFDPAEAQTVAAIQTELARMNCYTGGIDGAWGSGSASALQRYFEALGAAQAATDPGIGLYRTIIRNESVQCPDIQPVARAAPSRSSGGGTGTRSEPARTVTRNAPAAATPAPQGNTGAGSQGSGSSGRTINANPGVLGIGTFR